ncbi:MAG: AAA family ATPase [Candidatus Micrarchaeaceae archaeon]
MANDNDLNSLIRDLKTFEPFGTERRPPSLDFVIDYEDFINTLEEINLLVGLKNIKIQIAMQVKGFIVNYSKTKKPTNGEKLHTLLLGPPGCGKTRLGKLLAELWTNCGCFKNSGPVFNTKESNSNIITDIIKNTDSFKDIQLQTMKEKIDNINNSLLGVLTQLNNIRKKVKPKDEEDQRYIYIKFQDIKNKIKNILYSDINRPSQILPVIIPKVPGKCSTFGSIKLPFDEDIKPKKAKFVVLTKGDLIGKYQGHTTDEVRKILNKYINGVIMIDEAYDLCLDSNDSFGKEALTEIVSFMSEHPDKIIFIFAGYKKEIEETILKHQPGLARRFNWTLEIEKYTSDELFEIFNQQLKRNGYEIDKNAIENVKELFKQNKDYFPYSGGDTERLCKFVEEFHNNKLYDLVIKDNPVNNFNNIDFESINKGFRKYLDNSVEYKKLDKEMDKIMHIYN